jgi:hypothetical protein
MLPLLKTVQKPRLRSVYVPLLLLLMPPPVPRVMKRMAEKVSSNVF